MKYEVSSFANFLRLFTLYCLKSLKVAWPIALFILQDTYMKWGWATSSRFKLVQMFRVKLVLLVLAVFENDNRVASVVFKLNAIKCIICIANQTG